MDQQESITSGQFKSIMRRLAASVNVITSTDEGIMNGMTATAVCSVSNDPPSLLAIVNKSNRSHRPLSRSKIFAVNILSAAQESLANHFSAKVEEPFLGVEHTFGTTGCPLLSDADAIAECRVERAIDYFTHTIFIGRIIRCEVSQKAPLIYHEGRFRRLAVENTALL